MKRVFRGYPQALSVASMDAQRLMPYMVYRRDSRISEPVDERKRRAQEAEYLKGLYPLKVRKHQCLVEEACDRLEYAGSPMYDEFPDREFLYRTRDQIVRNALERGLEREPELTQVLLINEMNRRRLLP